MALPAAPPQILNAAAATETRVCILGKPTIYFHQKPPGHPWSVRLYGDLSVSHGLRRAVGARPLDHRVEISDVAAFMCVEVCSLLIHDLLDGAQASSEYETYDLAAKNWVDSSIRTSPRDIAEAIARYVRDLEFVDGDEIPGLEFDIHLPELRVSLIYTCAICSLDSDTACQGLVTLPCSHVFHTRCVAPWFHGTPTCPTCRLEIVDPFSFVRSATPDEEFMDVGAQDDDVLFEGESEDDKYEDGEVFDDESQEEPLTFMHHIVAEDDVLFEDESEDDLVFHDKSEDGESFDDESEDQPLMNIDAEDGVLFKHEFDDDPNVL